MSCASWMGRTLLFRVASGTKLLGVSSNPNLCKDDFKIRLIYFSYNVGIASSRNVLFSIGMYIICILYS